MPDRVMLELQRLLQTKGMLKAMAQQNVIKIRHAQLEIERQLMLSEDAREELESTMFEYIQKNGIG